MNKQEQPFNLNSEIKIEKDPFIEDVTNIKFGNTGLRLDYQPWDKKYFMHFNPDGSTDRIEGKELEYSYRFVLGISLLVDWLKSFKEDNLPYPEVIIGSTNFSMSDFRAKFFGYISKGIYKLFDDPTALTVRSTYFSEGESYDVKYEIDIKNMMEHLSSNNMLEAEKFNNLLNRAKKWANEN